MKKLFRYMCSATALVAPLAIILLPFISDAQGVTLLQDFGDSTLASGNPGAYLQKIYITAIGFAGILAVVILVWGGFELIASPVSEQMRTNAKNRIWAALGGLLLVLASVTILGTINPAFIKFDLKLTPSAQTGTPVGTGAGAPKRTIPPSNITHKEAEALLPNVSTNKPDKTDNTKSGNTSYTGMQSETIDEINDLTKKAGCAKTTCFVTGGTEVGHNGGTSHEEGTAFDFRPNDKVDAVIKGYTNLGTNTKGEQMYKNPTSGATYTRESDHWHVAVPTRFRSTGTTGSF